MSTLVNSEDPDEILRNVAFHQGLHFLLRRKMVFQKTEKQNDLEILTCDLLLYYVSTEL